MKSIAIPRLFRKVVTRVTCAPTANLKKFRVLYGVSARELAHAAGVTSGLICDLEHSRRTVSLERANKIHDALVLLARDKQREEPV